MTNDEIIEAIRGDNAEKAGEALKALFPDAVTVALFVNEPNRDVTLTTKTVDPRRFFVLLIQATVHIGAMLGLNLQWMQQQPQEDRLVVPGPGGVFR